MSKVGTEIKKISAFTLISSFSILLLFCGLFVELADANPYFRDFVGDTFPDASTKPPKVLILFPENNSIYAGKTLTLTLNVSIGDSSTASSRLISDIVYESDWLPSNRLYEYIPDASMYPSPIKTDFSTTINLSTIPEGTHNITVYVNEKGSYEKLDDMTIHYYNFQINSSSSVFFTIDNSPPLVSFSLLGSKTYHGFDVPLDFTVNERISLVSYVMDGGENVTIDGNTTLTGLSYGKHNVTLYAVDLAGNVGSSETITFTIAEPKESPVVLVAAASLGVALIAIGSLLIYFRKRAQRKTMLFRT